MNIRITKGIHKISYDKILYFISLGKRVHIVTSEKEYEYRGKLKDVADVTEEYFLLIHKSYLINMEHVEHYEYDNVVMKDKTRLSISKANRKKVRERLLTNGEEKIMNIHLITYLTSKLFWIYTVFRYNTILYPKNEDTQKLFVIFFVHICFHAGEACSGERCTEI